MPLKNRISLLPVKNKLNFLFLDTGFFDLLCLCCDQLSFCCDQLSLSYDQLSLCCNQ